MNLKKLKDPFSSDDIEWRIGQCGMKKDGEVWAKALAYIQSRAIHDRLDEVCSPGCWQMEYNPHHGGTVCRIGILCQVAENEYQWVWKSGGADNTDFEAFKGGLSSAEKRAGVPWGIGRYLYNLESTFVNCTTKRPQDKINWKYQGVTKNAPVFYWQPPMLPDWARPIDELPI